MDVIQVPCFSHFPLQGDRSCGSALFLGVNHQLFNSFAASSIFIPFPGDFPAPSASGGGAGCVRLHLLPPCPAPCSCVQAARWILSILRGRRGPDARRAATRRPGRRPCCRPGAISKAWLSFGQRQRRRMAGCFAAAQGREESGSFFGATVRVWEHRTGYFPWGRVAKFGFDGLQLGAESRGAASSEAPGSCAVPWGHRGEPSPRSPSGQDGEEEHQRAGITAVSTTTGCESPESSHAPREGLAERRDQLLVPCQPRAGTASRCRDGPVGQRGPVEREGMWGLSSTRGLLWETVGG